MVKKKIRQASPSFKKIFPQKPENIDVKRKIAKHASNCPVTFFTHKHFFPSSPVAQTHYYRAGGRIVCKKAQTRAFKTNNLKKQQYFKENVIENPILKFKDWIFSDKGKKYTRYFADDNQVRMPAMPVRWTRITRPLRTACFFFFSFPEFSLNNLHQEQFKKC